MLRRFFNRRRPTSDLPPAYSEFTNILPATEVNDAPPGYTESASKATGESASKATSKPASKAKPSVRSLIEKINNRIIDYVVLDETTVTPMDVLTYFKQNEWSSSNHVYLLCVYSDGHEPDDLRKLHRIYINGVSKDKDSINFYLVGRNAKVNTWTGYNIPIKEYGDIVNVTLDGPYMRSNFFNHKKADQTEIIENIARQFNLRSQKALDNNALLPSRLHTRRPRLYTRMSHDSLSCGCTLFM